MTNIVIQDSNCWICGCTNTKLTSHHGLPQHLRPKFNVVIPVCVSCHKKINASDIKGMFAYDYKLETLGLQVKNGATRLLRTVQQHVKDNEKGKSLNKEKSNNRK